MHLLLSPLSHSTAHSSSSFSKKLVKKIFFLTNHRTQPANQHPTSPPLSLCFESSLTTFLQTKIQCHFPPSPSQLPSPSPPSTLPIHVYVSPLQTPFPHIPIPSPVPIAAFIPSLKLRQPLQTMPPASLPKPPQTMTKSASSLLVPPVTTALFSPCAPSPAATAPSKCPSLQPKSTAYALLSVPNPPATMPCANVLLLMTSSNKCSTLLAVS